MKAYANNDSCSNIDFQEIIGMFHQKGTSLC